ncbi:hypothetical protein THERMOT_360 [Bathymodiolus thermophilus thioautotrophic gill symbiont]|nr:hypothetical protein THERMOT_360 [Bathymodiolus thermophilus thioautotrophic gill symbiont]
MNFDDYLYFMQRSHNALISFELCHKNRWGRVFLNLLV